MFHDPLHSHSGPCNSLQCIVPPHMLEHIARNARTATQREAAIQALVVTERFRGQRDVLSRFGHFVGTASGGKQRTVFDAKTGTDLPGSKVRGEGDPASPDVAVNEAYDGAGATYDLYFEVFGRNSLDNQGFALNSTVHYDQNYDNAFWNGQQMVYGDGDGKIFGRFTQCMDVIGHELTHGVTQFTAGLEYRDQSGALNESLSDIFGSLVKQRALKQDAASADWLIGAGIFAPGIKGLAIRSMKAPGTAYDDPTLGKDPQPAHMKNFVKTGRDNGGVHINSGIPNHAFYLLATKLGGNAWEKAGLIWYDALTKKFNHSSVFADAALATVQAAIERYGAGSAEENAVRASWNEVGLPVPTAVQGGWLIGSEMERAVRGK